MYSVFWFDYFCVSRYCVIEELSLKTGAHIWGDTTRQSRILFRMQGLTFCSASLMMLHSSDEKKCIEFSSFFLTLDIFFHFSFSALETFFTAGVNEWIEA